MLSDYSGTFPFLALAGVPWIMSSATMGVRHLFSRQAQCRRKSFTHGHAELATYARSPERIFASSLSTSTEWTT